MKLQLHFQGNMTIGQVKERFSSWFPYLKIEFFSQNHENGESLLLQQPIKDTAYLWEISTYLDDGHFSFSPMQTVGSFEQCLQIHFGLPVQVYRKTRNFWIETSQTDNLSLQQQNDIAAATCRPVVFNSYTLML